MGLLVVQGLLDSVEQGYCRVFVSVPQDACWCRISGFERLKAGFRGYHAGILGNYVAWDPDSRVPLVPGDLVSAATLVATAAAATGDSLWLA